MKGHRCYSCGDRATVDLCVTWRASGITDLVFCCSPCGQYALDLYRHLGHEVRVLDGADA